MYAGNSVLCKGKANWVKSKNYAELLYLQELKSETVVIYEGHLYMDHTY